MSVPVPTPGAKPALPPESAGVSLWLDALAAGACTQKQFLGKVQSLEQADPELPWEVLSLLDQYLRRERITQDVYASLKARLHQRYMGFGGGGSPTPSNVRNISPAQPVSAQPVPAQPVPAPTPVAGATAAISARSLRVGDVLRGRYRLIDILDPNPARTLFEATDQFKVEVPDVSHRVAIEVFGATQRADPGLLERVCRLQALTHSGIERIFDVDEDRGALFLSRESLKGVSLEQLLERDGARLSLPTSQGIVRSVASALAYAHLHNIYHGDVRSAHVFITDIGEVRLRNFEISAGDVPGNPRGDRLAFAWFAYQLLSGDSQGSGKSRPSKPPGVSREQWRALRNTMLGREGGDAGNVLTAFAGGNPPIVPLLREGENSRGPRRGNSLWTSVAIAALLIVAGYFAVTRGGLHLPLNKTPVAKAAPPAAASRRAAAGTPPKPASAEVVSANGAGESRAETAAPVALVPPAVAETVAVTPPLHTRAMIDLPSESKTVYGDEPVAKIWVRRRGGLTGEVTFLWWTERGSARVDADFREISPRMATIQSGASGVELLVPLVADESRQQPRTFYVKIDEPGSGATLGDRTLMQVSIVPPGY
ncbi:MAG: protein kinase [Pseudomonadota bacterium]